MDEKRITIKEFLCEMLGDTPYGPSMRQTVLGDRRILELLERDSELHGFGMNRHNGIVMLRDKRKGGDVYIKSYTCNSMEAPLVSSYGTMRWVEINNTHAARLINTQIWSEGKYLSDEDINERPNIRHEWTHICTTKLLFIRRPDLIEYAEQHNFKKEDDLYSVIDGWVSQHRDDNLIHEISLELYRLKSGKIRVENNNQKKIQYRDFLKVYTEAEKIMGNKTIFDYTSHRSSVKLWTLCDGWFRNDDYIAYEIINKVDESIMDEIKQERVINIMTNK